MNRILKSGLGLRSQSTRFKHPVFFLLHHYMRDYREIKLLGANRKEVVTKNLWADFP